MTESVSTQSTKRWMKPVAIAVAVALVVVTVGYSYASPYVVLHRLKVAADARDAASLNDYVDYPALRVSLKEQAGEMVQRRIGAEHSNNPLLLFGAAIGTALIGPIVDAYATPEGVAALLNGIPPNGKPGDTPPPVSDGGEAHSPAPTDAPARSSAPAASAENKQARPQSTAGYRSLNEFVVTWQHSANGERYSAVLQRHGLFSWKLAAVELNEPAQPVH
ncbi:DUF2939 domain-containing protein [Paraburkholderia dinghuensis]|uniref:DUF2939 domain-containing protein n=1 Tax=Paraburkholderia dinghuensis TaxID=2305225 RepID=A0A3N6NFQ7_9BURK|nr:DUF2939 domain-containing protein [Paraburkholderia dinghuensis]RQH07467.1 DUF2939 domain-containing protein [Paraburkholderia dinghuensis]